MTEKEIQALFASFKDSRIMIIGDIMIDAYLWGEVNRISPEAPVPVVAVKTRENRLGGAANVARNIKALGAQPILCSVIGEDFKGDEFLQLLDDEKMPQQGIVRSAERITTTKFRILGNNTQMLRVDEEKIEPLSKNDEVRFVQRINEILEAEKIDAIIFQDYDKGVLGKTVIETITHLANQKNIPITVDPKKKHFMDYKKVTLFKPNLKELKEGVKAEFRNDDQEAIRAAVNQLQQKLSCQMLMVTLSEYGIFIKYDQNDGGHSYHEPAHKREIADVSGAGDTVISTATLCLAQNMSPANIAAISNLAGGLVCEEVGVVPINPEKLKNEICRIFQ